MTWQLNPAHTLEEQVKPGCKYSDLGNTGRGGGDILEVGLDSMGWSSVQIRTEDTSILSLVAVKN